MCLVVLPRPVASNGKVDLAALSKLVAGSMSAPTPTASAALAAAAAAPLPVTTPAPVLPSAFSFGIPSPNATEKAEKASALVEAPIDAPALGASILSASGSNGGSARSASLVPAPVSSRGEGRVSHEHVSKLEREIRRLQGALVRRDADVTVLGKQLHDAVLLCGVAGG